MGRNDPCPCGSGKKYKKCCDLNKTASRRFEPVSTTAHSGFLKDRITNVSALIREQKEKKTKEATS